MDAQDVILTTIASEDDQTLNGRTLLQKKVYFVSILTSIDLGYEPHYYGPYSAKIADTLNVMVSNEFIRESIEVFQSTTNAFGERRRHSYSLTDDGLKVLGNRQGDNRIVEALKQVNGDPISNDFDLLSVAAKVHFIANGRADITASEIKGLAKEYGWELTESRIDKGLSYLVRLNLVKME